MPLQNEFNVFSSLFFASRRAKRRSCFSGKMNCLEWPSKQKIDVNCEKQAAIREVLTETLFVVGVWAREH